MLTKHLSQLHHRIDRRPPFNVWSILKISEVWYVLFESISWHEGAICLQSWHQIPRKIFLFLNSDSAWVSSQVLIMCHDNTSTPNVYENTRNIKFHVSRNKTQDMHTTTQTEQISQSSQTRTTSTFLHDVSLRSVSNSKFWMPSWTLLSLSSLRDIWHQNEPQTTNKTNMQTKCVYCVNQRSLAPF